MKPTPGPWTFDHDWRRIPTIFGADGTKVASVEKDYVRGLFSYEKPERSANARLIAAAPDLLAALHRCVEVIEFAYMSAAEQPRELDEARTAIAKAYDAISQDKRHD